MVLKGLIRVHVYFQIKKTKLVKGLRNNKLDHNENEYEKSRLEKYNILFKKYI